jgi:hypothetical protein
MWDTERETIRRETQTQRGASWNTDVIVPAGQSLLIAAGVTVGSLALATLATIGLSGPWWIPPASCGVLGALAFAVSAILLTLDHRRLLWTAEKALQVDLDGDEAVGEPEQSEPLHVELLERNGNRTRLSMIGLPHKDKLPIFARGLLNGKGTAGGAWYGCGNPMSKPQYQAVRDAMIERGLAHWINPDAHAQGWDLTAAGWAVMRRIAKTGTALPRGGIGRNHA